MQIIGHPAKINPKSAWVNLLIILFSIAYAYILSELPLEAFKDRANYLIYAESSGVIALQNYYSGVLVFLSNEPVWLFLNMLLGYFLDPESTVRLLIFFPAFFTSYFVLKTNPTSKHLLFLIVFLFAPQVIKNNIIHLRQGVAISVFLAGWFSFGFRRFFFIGLTPFIHASFFFVVFMILINWFFFKIRFAFDVRFFLWVFVGLIVGLVLGHLASFLGARQANEYDFSMTDVSGLGFVFWLGVFGLFFLEGRRFLNGHSLEVSGVLFYLSTYFLMEVTGRIFESVVVLVFIAGLSLSDWRKPVFISASLGYMAGIYFIRAGQPWLGWGV